MIAMASIDITPAIERVGSTNAEVPNAANDPLVANTTPNALSSGLRLRAAGDPPARDTPCACSTDEVE
jgi:hypothetical protein